MKAELIRRTGLAVSPWRNGAGRKADIAAGPGWLAGFAWLDANAPFSDYAGYGRTITLLEGPGFRLDFPPPAPPLLVRDPWTPRPFDGGAPAQCRILGGPCMVLNAMTDRAAWRHSVRVLAGADLPEVGDGLAVVLRGAVASEAGEAGPLDALRLPTGAALRPARMRWWPSSALQPA